MKQVLSILEKQVSLIYDSWGESVQRYPDTINFWQSAEAHVERIKGKHDFIASYNTLTWSEIINDSSVVLDIGCGSGWLSALLSREARVKEIYALDSSKNNLEDLMPRVVRLLNGSEEKITPVLGLFDELNVLGKKFDLVVASASLHHSMDMRNTLTSINRVLKDGGGLVLLNEIPSSKSRYLFRLIKMFSKAFVDNIRGVYPRETPLISSSGIMYNQSLGDWTYSIDQWCSHLSETGFECQYFPLANKKGKFPGIYREENRGNFVCVKKNAL